MKQQSGTMAPIACYFGDRKTGQLAIIDLREDLSSRIQLIPATAPTGGSPLEKTVLIGATDDARAVIFDPKTKKINVQSDWPADSFAAHVYRDPYSGHDWYMNDGDKENGNDTLNCGTNGSSVTVAAASGTPEARFLATICVGRGHHQAAFSAPSTRAPHVPRRAFISNLKDGTLSVIGTDTNDRATYLKCIATINLCEPEKESEPGATIPNSAYPHGLAFSPVSGKVYNLNNGYGTVAIIDPLTLQIEQRLSFKGHSNLFITAGGRYIIGRGADRKRDPKHVIAKLSVLDVETLRVTDTMDLPDIYISKYFLSPDDRKLYLTTSVSGSPEQQANLKSNVVVAIDLGALPKLKVCAELKLGQISGLVFPSLTQEHPLAVASDAGSGTLVVIGTAEDRELKRIATHDACEYTRIWLAGN